MMKRAAAAVSLTAFGAMLAGAAPVPGTVAPKPAGPVLMDGRCHDAAWRSAASLQLGHGVTMRLISNEDFLYVCIEPSADSFATLDLFFRTPQGTLLNLHASAQVGEWIRGAQGWSEQWNWGNNVGWTGNTNRYLGRAAGEGRPPFAAAEGRELQIARSKIGGKGVIPMMAVIQQIRGADGKMKTITFPDGANEGQPQSWGALLLN